MHNWRRFSGNFARVMVGSSTKIPSDSASAQKRRGQIDRNADQVIAHPREGVAEA